MRPVRGECDSCHAGSAELVDTWTCEDCGLVICDDCAYVVGVETLCRDCALPVADAEIASLEIHCPPGGAVDCTAVDMAGHARAAGRQALQLAARILEADAAQSKQRAAAYRGEERGRTLHCVARALRRHAAALRWRAATDPLRGLGDGDVRRLDLPRPSSVRPGPAAAPSHGPAAAERQEARHVA